MSGVLRAVQVIRDEGIAKPILIGRRSEIERRIQSAGLRIREGMILKLFILSCCEFFGPALRRVLADFTTV